MNVSMAHGHAGVRAMRALLCIFVIGFCVSAPASAQESRKAWRISNPTGNSTVYDGRGDWRR